MTAADVGLFASPILGDLGFRAPEDFIFGEYGSFEGFGKALLAHVRKDLDTLPVLLARIGEVNANADPLAWAQSLLRIYASSLLFGVLTPPVPSKSPEPNNVTLSSRGKSHANKPASRPVSNLNPSVAP